MASDAAATELRTSRLLARGWRDTDRDPFAALNADPQVMAHLPAPLDRAQSDALADLISGGLERRGFGLWAVEAPGVAGFIGFVGLQPVPFEASFTPAVEVAWRLARAYWGRGYATEAAGAALRYGFKHLDLDEIVSFTVPANGPSRRVMERLGMLHDPDRDFDHPRLPPGHRLRRHVLYRISAGDWRFGLRQESHADALGDEFAAAESELRGV